MVKVNASVHRLEVEAYRAVYKVFAATNTFNLQTDKLLTMLRHELHIQSTDELEIKETIESDPDVVAIRDGKVPPSEKKAKTAAPAAAMRLNPPDADMPPPPPRATQSKKRRALERIKPAPAPANPTGPAPGAQERPTASSINVDELIGRKVIRFWPDEGGWHEAVVTDYRKESDEHCLTYNLGLGPEKEKWEWFQLRKKCAANPSEIRMTSEYVNLLDAVVPSQALTVTQVEAISSATKIEPGFQSRLAQATQVGEDALKRLKDEVDMSGLKLKSEMMVLDMLDAMPDGSTKDQEVAMLEAKLREVSAREAQLRQQIETVIEL
ncbi:unnamed protein product [Pedinophyceae sp. YPF-701]|nr:unnamed protein product [Pedinophyceae sp. YPF-701]